MNSTPPEYCYFIQKDIPVVAEIDHPPMYYVEIVNLEPGVYQCNFTWPYVDSINLDAPDIYAVSTYLKEFVAAKFNAMLIYVAPEPEI